MRKILLLSLMTGSLVGCQERPRCANEFQKGEVIQNRFTGEKHIFISADDFPGVGYVCKIDVINSRGETEYLAAEVFVKEN